MQTEIKVVEANQTWTIVHLPGGIIPHWKQMGLLDQKAC